MGISTSRSTVDSMINNSISVINTYAQTCTAGTQNANNQIDLQKCDVTPGGRIVIDSGQAVNISCLTNANTSSAISSSVTQNIRSAAQAISQQFSFPSITDAESFVNASVTLGQAIANTYTSNCLLAQQNQNNTIKCTDSEISGLVEIQSAQTAAINCVLIANTVNEARNKVISLLDVSSIAKQEPTFVYLVYGVLIFFAILAWFCISIANNPFIEWGIVFIVFFLVVSTIIYTYTAKSAGNYPYKK